MVKGSISFRFLCMKNGQNHKKVQKCSFRAPLASELSIWGHFRPQNRIPHPKISINRLFYLKNDTFFIILKFISSIAQEGKLLMDRWMCDVTDAWTETWLRVAWAWVHLVVRFWFEFRWVRCALFYCFVFEEIVRCWDFLFYFSETKGGEFKEMRGRRIFWI